MGSSTGVKLAQVLVALFLSVLFLQSGMDKALDWKGNREAVRATLAQTWLGWASGFLLLVVMGLELLAGMLCAAGLLLVFLGQSPAMALAGAVLGALALVSLSFGQRLAKDHAGAAALAGYFLLDLVGVVLLGTN